MIEDVADLWALDCHARCITTNGTIRADGRGVMGRGVAKQAVDRYRQIGDGHGRIDLRRRLGIALAERGNCVQILLQVPGEPPLVMFPVKYAWSQSADLGLIEKSALQLVQLADQQENWGKVVLPRPGCGNGGRSWEREVRPLIRPILDDRFLVVTL